MLKTIREGTHFKCLKKSTAQGQTSEQKMKKMKGERTERQMTRGKLDSCHRGGEINTCHQPNAAIYAVAVIFAYYTRHVAWFRLAYDNTL